MTDESASRNGEVSGMIAARLEYIEAVARLGGGSPSRDELAAFADGYQAGYAAARFALSERRYSCPNCSCESCRSKGIS